MKKAIFTSILLAFVISASAQKMIIHKKNGEKLSIPLSQILKITYEDSKKLPLFVLTKNEYRETANLDEAVEKEFKGKYRIADWNDIKKYSKHAKEIVKDLHLNNYEGVFITANGKHLYKGVRHYHLSYYNHEVPKAISPIADINDNYLCLVGGFMINMPILCIRK